MSKSEEIKDLLVYIPEKHLNIVIQTIEELEQAQEILLDENKRLSQKVRELRRKTSFRVYEENLALAQEIEKYKEMIKGNQHADR